MTRKPARKPATPKKQKIAKTKVGPAYEYLATLPDRKLPAWAVGDLRPMNVFRYFLEGIVGEARNRGFDCRFGDQVVHLRRGKETEFALDFSPLTKVCSLYPPAEWGLWTTQFFEDALKKRLTPQE